MPSTLWAKIRWTSCFQVLQPRITFKLLWAFVTAAVSGRWPLSATALSAHLGALYATKLLIEQMIAATCVARLRSADSLQELLNSKWDRAVNMYLSSLHEV